jgi:hypothetical protein
MRLAILTGVTALLLIVFIFELLRRRQLREKYAVLWLVVGLGIIPVGFSQGLVNTIARHVGVANGASLVLFLAVVFLLLTCIHLSWEASQLEDETRTLAEEIALIRTELRDLKQDVQAGRGVTVVQDVDRERVVEEAVALTAAAVPTQRDNKGELVDD